MANTHAAEAFYVGDDCPIRGLLHNADGSAFDLTGASVEWKLIKAGVVVMTKTLGAGLVVVGLPTAGEVLISLTKAETVALAAGTYRDQCRAENAGQGKSTQWVGEIVFKATL